MKNYLDNQFDEEFDEEFDTINVLKWYPWGGKNCAKTAPNVLILGLSKYAVDKDSEYCERTEQIFVNLAINRGFLL